MAQAALKDSSNTATGNNATGMVGALMDEFARVGTDSDQLARDYEALFSRLRRVLVQSVMPLSSPSDAAETALGIADAIHQSALRAFPRQTQTACQAQCSACCHLPVQVPGGMGTMIARHVEATMMPAERDALHRKLLIRATHDEANPEGTTGQACPFLSREGTCQIYAVRPPSCRAFTSPCAQTCHSAVFDHHEGETPSIDQNAIIYRIYAEANMVLEQRAKHMGQKRGQEPLAATVLRHWR